MSYGKCVKVEILKRKVRFKFLLYMFFFFCKFVVDIENSLYI